LRTINEVLESQEYKIKKEIEAEIDVSLKKNFREYFWDIIHNYWGDFKGLEAKSLKNILFRKILKDLHPKYLEGDKVNPIEFYEYPVHNLEISSGAIFSKDGLFYVCINNDCDLTLHNGVCKILKINLLEIKDFSHLIQTSGNAEENKKANFELLNNNKLGHREKDFFFPRTYFFRGGYVNFGDVISKEIIIEEQKINLDNIGVIVAKMHAPFFHRLISNFSRYYNRFGTPNIDVS